MADEELSAAHFLQNIKVGETFDMQMFDSVRSMFNIDSAINTHFDNFEIETQAMTFFTLDQDQFYEKPYGSALCRPYQNFKMWQLKLDYELQPSGGDFPFPQNGIPFTDQVHELSQEFMDNFNVKLQLAKYFGILNESMADPRRFLETIFEKQTVLYDYFVSQETNTMKDYWRRSISDVMGYDQTEGIWGPAKLLGFSLLYGVRVVSAILLLAIRTGQAVNFHLFVNNPNSQTSGPQLRFLPTYYDQATMEMQEIGQFRYCLLPEYFKAILNFLKFDQQYLPNISFHVYCLIMEVIMQIGPVLSEYESVYGWKNREYNPCDEVRAIISEIVSYSGVMTQQAGLLFRGIQTDYENNYYAVDFNKIADKLIMLHQSIQLYNASGDFAYIKYFIERVAAQAFKNSDDYCIGLAHIFDIPLTSSLFTDLQDIISLNYSQNNHRSVFYLYDAFLQNFIPANVRYLLYTVKYTEFLYSDDVYQLKVAYNELARGRLGCCKSYVTDSGSVFEMVRHHIDAVTKELEKPPAKVFAYLFINLLFDSVEFLEQAALLAGSYIVYNKAPQTSKMYLSEYKSVQDDATSLLFEIYTLKEDSKFLTLVEALFENVQMIAEWKYKSIAHLKQIEVQMLSEEFSKFCEVCYQSVPELKDIAEIGSCTVSEPSYSDLERFYLQLKNEDKYWVFNWFLHTSGRRIQKAKQIDDKTFQVEQPAEQSRCSSKLSSLAFIIQAEEADNQYLIKSVSSACRVDPQTFELLSGEINRDMQCFVLYLPVRAFLNLNNSFLPVSTCVLRGAECDNCYMYRAEHYLSISRYFGKYMGALYYLFGVPVEQNLRLSDIEATLLAAARKYDVQSVVADLVLLPFLTAFRQNEISPTLRYIALKHATAYNALGCEKAMTTYLRNTGKADLIPGYFEKLLAKYANNNPENTLLRSALQFATQAAAPQQEITVYSAGQRPSGKYIYLTQTYMWSADFLSDAACVLLFAPPNYASEQYLPVATITFPVGDLDYLCRILFLKASRVKQHAGSGAVRFSVRYGIVFVNEVAVSSTSYVQFKTATISDDKMQIQVYQKDLESLVRRILECNLLDHTKMNTFRNAGQDSLLKTDPCPRVVISVSWELLEPLRSLASDDVFVYGGNELEQVRKQLFLLYVNKFEDSVSKKMKTTFENNVVKEGCVEQKLLQQIVSHYSELEPRHKAAAGLAKMFSEGGIGNLLAFMPNVLLTPDQLVGMYQSSYDLVLMIE